MKSTFGRGSGKLNTNVYHWQHIIVICTFSPTILTILFLSSQLGYFLPFCSHSHGTQGIRHRGSRWVECAGYQLQVFPGVIQYANSFNSNSRFCLYFSSTRICLLQRLFSIQRIVCQAYKGKQTNQTQCRYVDSAGYQLQYLMTRHIYLFL